MLAALLSLAFAPWVPADPGRVEPATSAVIDANGPFETHLAANGGWKVAAWRDHEWSVRAQVTSPDGKVLERVLDREASGQQPSVGIDAQGNALVAWPDGDRARTARGPGLERGPDIPGAETVDVAVSPGGRTLTAWSSAGGSFAQIDRGAPQRVDEASAMELQTAINDAGAAVVAHHSFAPDGVRLVDRAPDGAWSASRDVSSGNQIPLRMDENDPNVRRLAAALSADGRAVLAWNAPRGAGRVIGLAGRAGGAWDTAQRLSAPVVGGYAEDASLDAAGDPRVTWEEEGRPRGAKPVAGAVPDLTPLTARARLSRRLAPVRTGLVTVTARVRCSKACTARLGWAGLWGGPWYGRARDPGPGETATVRLRAFDERLLHPRHSGRFRVTLVVTDRAGHVVKRVHTYRVRVVRPPLRSFKVGPSHSFAMYTRAGDRAVGRFVNALLEGLADGSIRSERELIERYQAGVRAIDDAGHGGVGDTEVGDAIFEVVRRPFALAGYSAEAVLGA